MTYPSAATAELAILDRLPHTMRITIVQGAFLPVPPVSGGAVEKIWFALGKEFASRGHQVTHVSRRHGTLAWQEFIDGVHHIRVSGFDIPASLARLKWRDLRYSQSVLKILPEADVLVTNTFWLPVLARKPKQGRIYVHVARYPKGQFRFYGKAARLQVVSTVIQNAVCKEVPKFAPRVKVIPNFVSHVGAPGPSERQKCVLYVGRIHREKGIDLLIDAFAQLLSMGLDGWKLRLVGPWEVAHGGGGEEFFRSLRNRAQDLGNSVEWIGPVFDAEKLRAHYRESSVFVYPSTASEGEASPLAPLEAMAEGCPPVVSSLGCFGDYLSPGRNGWIFDHRGVHAAENLAAVLKNAIMGSNVLAEAGESAKRTAQQFTLAEIAKRYLTDFEEVARQ